MHPILHETSLAGRALVAALFPRRCPACDRVIDAAGVASFSARPDVCARCRASVVRLEGRGCRKCGAEPAPGAQPSPRRCRRCRGRRFAFRRALAAVRYSGAVRALVLGVKFGRRREGLDVLARLLAMHVAAARVGDALDARAIIVAAPLHPTRRFARGFDQAAELARRVARLLGVRYVPGALRRRRRTHPQSLARPGERSAAVERAFGAGPFGFRVRGRTVLLVDDVISTGATADQAARALLALGARRVYVAAAAT